MDRDARAAVRRDRGSGEGRQGAAAERVAAVGAARRATGQSRRVLRDPSRRPSRRSRSSVVDEDRATAACSSSSARAARRASSCAASTSGTGSSRPCRSRLRYRPAWTAAKSRSSRTSSARRSHACGRRTGSRAGTSRTSARASGSSCPSWTLEVNEEDVLHDEPLTRGRGKAHMLEIAYPARRGDGVRQRRHPTGIGEEEFRRAPRSREKGGWTRWCATRNCTRRARFAIRTTHDRACTAGTGCSMNTEQGARAMRHVAFLD